MQRTGWRCDLTMNRPDRLNAVTEEMYEGLVKELAAASDDPTVRVVVLRGAGRAFCVGADLKDHGVAERSEDDKRRYAQFGQDAAAAIMDCSKPVVAAVHGHAIGAGLELALACDLSVVADEAKLRFPEFGLGTFVGGGTTFTLVERVGLTKARELLLLGRFFRGRDAAAWGLCNEAAPADDVPQRAEAFAEELHGKAPRSLAFAKRLLRQARDLSIPELLRQERDALAACMGTPDWREGLAAFREGRNPEFRGE